MVPLSLAVLALLLLGLAVFVLRANPTSSINRYFGTYTASIAGWAFSIGILHSGASPELWSKLAFSTSSFIPACFLAFSTVFPSSSRWPSRLVLRLTFLVASMFALLSIGTPLLIHDAAVTPTGFTRASGPLYPFFVIYFLVAWLTALAVLFSKWRRAIGRDRLQLQYLGIGFITSFVPGVTTNLLFPFFFGRTVYTWLGPYFSLPLVLAIGHTIIRHRLMDARVVVRRGATYVFAIASAALLFVAIAYPLARVTGYEHDRIPLVDAFFVALVLAVAFQRTKDWIQHLFDRYLYRATYDYQKTIRDASQRLSTILELDPLLEHLASVIVKTFKAEGVTVYLHDSRSLPASFALRFPAPHDSALPPQVIHENSPLLSLFRQHHGTLVREELNSNLGHPSYSAAGRSLADLAGEIAFPLLDEGALGGVVIVGPKRSGDPYFAHDITLLETLMSQASVAMKNAQLYREVLLVNEYVDNILSTMESGVIAVGTSGAISLFNAAAERLTGLNTARGKPCDVLPPSLESPLRQTLKSQTPRSQFETVIQHPAGFSVPLVCSTAVLSQRDGSIHGALVVFSDVTRLKDLEREKRRAERLASFGAFASGVAHEIKNPLVAIRTFAELLPERFADSDFRNDFSKVVIHEITRIDDLVGRLRGIATTSPRHIAAIDISDPLRETLRLLRAQLEQAGTVVRCDVQDPAPLVAVEEAQLKQLFLNLFLNAVEAMGPGGEITVVVARRDRQGAHWIVAEVGDSGPGIPEPLRTSIFDPFFTTKPRGSGLGLAICRGITDAHHGSIRAENRTDRPGTVITVEFPAHSETPTGVEQPVHG